MKNDILILKLKVYLWNLEYSMYLDLEILISFFNYRLSSLWVTFLEFSLGY